MRILMVKRTLLAVAFSYWIERLNKGGGQSRSKKGKMSHYKGAASEGDRARKMLKMREERREALAMQQRRLEEETARKMNIQGKVRGREKGERKREREKGKKY